MRPFLKISISGRNVFGLARNDYHSRAGVFGVRPQTEDGPSSHELKFKPNDLNNVLFYQVIRSIREKGHLLAKVNPLKCDGSDGSELKNSATGQKLLILLEELEKDTSSINIEKLIELDGRASCTYSELSFFLQTAYCGKISAEFMYISNEAERDWFAKKFERLQFDEQISELDKKLIAKVQLESELFDKFVGLKFPTVKRYGGEGAECMMVCFNELFKVAAGQGLTDIVIGMPHRGRLNLLSGLLNFPSVVMFRKMQGLSEFDLSKVPGTTGDVLSHLFTSVDLPSATNKTVHVTLLANPSHLEAISPVVCGKARARSLSKKVASYSIGPNVQKDACPVLPVQVHGDAAFAGQGVIAELLAMSQVANFQVDGSIHIIVNNQVGYTTPGARGRSSRYCSDVMKMIEAPVIHVNGDSPEDVVRATRLAIEYRQTFKKDVAIDLVCFRKWGHNELDDPTFTNPLMYKDVKSRERSLPEKYARQVFDEVEYLETVEGCNKRLGEQLAMTSSYQVSNNNLQERWAGIVHPSSTNLTTWDTGVDLDLLRYVGAKSAQSPDGFQLHATLNKVLGRDRVGKLIEGQKLDWATAEALAFGSLLYQGYNVRLSGQDVGRGTFSQRHAMLVDQNSGQIHVPLNHLKPDQSGFLEVANSILSEEAGLAFEYGFSIESPQNLVIWEAQFGDFFNGAQIMLDTLVSSGERKWLYQSGLTLLLPHGYDGAGPEHSSCRIERFLQMCDSKEDEVDGDNVNWSVANPTTPAQFFHLLRRQMVRNYRKPLIVASPKLLLRHPQCVSTLGELELGTFFRTVLEDPTNPIQGQVRKVVFCSGKHYYALDSERKEKQLLDVAIVRIEELCPFPAKDIIDQLNKYSKATEFVWSQEEQRNMGCWTFVNARFAQLLKRDLRYVGRPVLGSPAVGIGAIHKEEAEEVVKRTFQ